MGKGDFRSKPPVRLWSHGKALRHCRVCKDKPCDKCWWARKGRKFKAFFPWLRFGRRLNDDASGFGFGCSACAQFACQMSSTTSIFSGKNVLPTPCRSNRMPVKCSDNLENFAAFAVGLHRLKSYTLRRHQDSQKHQEALRFMEGSVSENDLVSAPSYLDFVGKLEDMQKGHSMRNGGSCSDRTVLMHWCISESLLRLWRCKLSKATTLCLVRDERKGKLLIRFRSCSNDMDVCSGTLGCVRMKGGSAEDIVTATAKAMRIFCTSFFNAPRLGKGLQQQGGFDRSLFNHMRSIVHMLTTDSHPAELLSSNIMKGNRKSAEERHNRDPFLPNVVLVGRDGAHASTRLVKRPWSCIAVLQETFEFLNDNCAANFFALQHASISFRRRPSIAPFGTLTLQYKKSSIRSISADGLKTMCIKKETVQEQQASPRRNIALQALRSQWDACCEMCTASFEFYIEFLRPGRMHTGHGNGCAIFRLIVFCSWPLGQTQPIRCCSLHAF